MAIALLVGACGWPVTDDLQLAKFTNATDRAVIVYFDYPDFETDFMTLSPGESDFTNFAHPTDSCAPATMIARDSAGVEVDRMDETFCVGDHWEIQNSN